MTTECRWCSTGLSSSLTVFPKHVSQLFLIETLNRCPLPALLLGMSASRRWPVFKTVGGPPLQHRTVGNGTAHVACDNEPCRRIGIARAVASADLVVFLWYSARESNT